MGSVMTDKLNMTRSLSALILVIAACSNAGSATSGSAGSAADRGAAPAAGKEVTLLNVSYDPTRELYTAVNAVFAKQWEARTGQKVKIEQSHGGSGKQARAVI